MGMEQPWGLHVSQSLMTERTDLQKTVEASVQAPVPGKKTMVETPPAQAKLQTAKNELLQLAHGGKEVDLVSFSSHLGHICNVSNFMEKSWRKHQILGFSDNPSCISSVVHCPHKMAESGFAEDPACSVGSERTEFGGNQGAPESFFQL